MYLYGIQITCQVILERIIEWQSTTTPWADWTRVHGRKSWGTYSGRMEWNNRRNGDRMTPNH